MDGSNKSAVKDGLGSVRVVDVLDVLFDLEPDVVVVSVAGYLNAYALAFVARDQRL
jgi:hypothetical protein